MTTRVRDYDELYPGRFLKAGAFLGQKPTYTIQGVNVEELHGDKGGEMKATVVFADCKQGWVMCKTNGLCLKGMFGRVLDDWVGKRVTLFADEFEGEPCIRVWGSPDIAQPVDVLIAFPRKKPYTRRMQPTGGTQRTQASQAPKEKREIPPELQPYAASLREANSPDALVAIEDSLVEDNQLSAEHSAQVLRWIEKRRATLSATSG